MKQFIAFLLVISAVFAFGLTVTKNASTYNPMDTVSYTVSLVNTTENETASSVLMNITITNSTGAGQNITQVTTNSSGEATNTYPLPSSASAGTWTITATMANNSSVTNTTTFTVNALAASTGNISVNATSYNPGDAVFVGLANVLTQVGTSHNGTATVYLYTGSTQRNQSTVTITNGAGNTTFALPSSALNATWTANASFNSSGTSFTVNQLPRNPGISASNPSGINKGAGANVSITITNNANFNDTFTVTAAGCSSFGNCSATSPTIAAGASGNATLTVNVSASANATSHAVNISVNSSTSSSYSNTTSITVTVNPAHSFNISLNQSSATGTPAGSAVPFTLTITNNGEASETYNVACTNTLNWTCSPNPSSLVVSNGTQGNVTISATVAQSAYLGNISLFTVNVTSVNYSSSSNSRQFNVTAGPSSGAALTFYSADAIDTYWVKVSQNRTFVLAINNSGNTAANYTLNITAGSWNLSVSSTDCSISSTTVGATNTSSFACSNVAGLSTKNVSVMIIAPSNATPCTSTTIGFIAQSSTNTSVSSGTATVNATAPCFTSTPVLTYVTSTGVLAVSITSVTREGTASNISSITYAIISPSGTTLNSGSANLSTTYNLNYSNSTAYPSNSNYTLSITVVDNSSGSYSSGALNYRFRIARSITLSGTTALTTVAGASYANTITSALDTGESVPPSVTATPVCTTTSTSSPYIFSCTAPSLSTSYTVSSSSSSCAYGANITCTISPALSSSFTVSVTITTQQPPQQGGNQTNQTNQTTPVNQTANVTVQNINYTVPAAVNVTNAGNLTITVSNPTNVSQALNVSLEEQGDYLHFELNVSAPATVAAGANATLAVNVTPYRYARPGNYTVTVNINGQKKNYTVTVQPKAYLPDTVNVNRHVEVAKNKSDSVVYLEVVNKKTKTVNVTVRETIPKTLANSTAGITFLTPYTSVVEDDPVVEWVLSLAPGETADIKYSVKKDAQNVSFAEPQVTEALANESAAPPTVEVTPQGDNTWILVIVGIVVILGAAFAYLYFVERPLFYRLMQGARFRLDSLVRWLKK